MLGAGGCLRRLIGAYFTSEFAIEGAALFNPSMVPHPDQSGCHNGSVKFVMSLRTVGEGHISSISFREGVASDSGHFSLWPEPQFALAATADPHSGQGGPVTVRRHESAPLSGNVIFPITPAQAKGLEDLRLVRFTEEDGSQPYYGTYTAYSGREVSCEMMTTDRFSSFDLTPMRGAAAKHKGLALFPRRINGKYAAIGRLGRPCPGCCAAPPAPRRLTRNIDSCPIGDSAVSTPTGHDFSWRFESRPEQARAQSRCCAASRSCARRKA
jgi:hypothetical protein